MVEDFEEGMGDRKIEKNQADHKSDPKCLRPAFSGKDDCFSGRDLAVKRSAKKPAIYGNKPDNSDEFVGIESADGAFLE